ncbi:hypothetical protein [Microcoleus sp. F4-D5]|uniref:hypothetical protein n=1 Tax=Microcoleus sp. F4-D5 TaxID=2818760 RepID=UPI002FD4CB9A
MTNLEEIKNLKQSIEAELLRRPGVTGVDIGYKYVNGERTDEIVIRVYVTKKKILASYEAIPREIHGIKTDVIESTFDALISTVITELIADSEINLPYYNTLVGGISIGPYRSTNRILYFGTLGAIVEDNNPPYNLLALSNYHVLLAGNINPLINEIEIGQPSRRDGGKYPDDIFGVVMRAALKDGGSVDCATASIRNSRAAEAKIEQIGKVKGTTSAILGMQVRKRGRTTGLTYGIVDGCHATVQINYPDPIGAITLTDQITIVPDPKKSAVWTEEGDSGAAIVMAGSDDEVYIVGLHVSGNSDGSRGTANHIDAVERALNVKVATFKDWRR